MTDPERLKHRKLLRKSTLIILTGIGIATLITVLIVKQSPSIKESFKSVGSATEYLLSDLSIHLQQPSGEFAPYSGKFHEGDNLSLRLSVLRPTFVGVMLSVNKQSPEFVFYGRLPPGKGRLVERQGSRYVYHVALSDKTLKFCAVFAEDEKSLYNKKLNMSKEWELIPPSSCLILSN